MDDMKVKLLAGVVLLLGMALCGCGQSDSPSSPPRREGNFKLENGDDVYITYRKKRDSYDVKIFHVDETKDRDDEDHMHVWWEEISRTQ